MHGKAIVALRGFAFGTRQRVFIVGRGVQKYRKIFAHSGVTLCQHGFRGTAHHDIIRVVRRQAHEFVAHSTADAVDARGGQGGWRMLVLAHGKCIQWVVG